MGFFSDIIGGITGKTAAQATTQAADVAAQAEREKLAYLKDYYALPTQFRDIALPQVAALSGALGPEELQRVQGGLVESAKASPVYEAIMSGRGAGEEGILRTASATGGLRSGNTIEDLATFNRDLQNQALLTSYGGLTSGLQNLAGLSGGAEQIAQATAAPGLTQAQGILGAGQARQQGVQNLFNLGLGVGSLLI